MKNAKDHGRAPVRRPTPAPPQRASPGRGARPEEITEAAFPLAITIGASEIRSRSSLHTSPAFRIRRAGHHPHQILAENGGAPHRLNVLNHQLGATCVTYKWPGPRIIHGVGKIPGQHYLEAEPGHLPCPETAVQNTDIG